MSNRANTSTATLASAIDHELRTLGGKANLRELVERAAALEQALYELLNANTYSTGKAERARFREVQKAASAALAKAQVGDHTANSLAAREAFINDPKSGS